MTDRHRCLAAAQCSSSVVEDDRKLPAPTESPDSLCSGCERIMERAVKDLPETWVALHAAMGDNNRRPDQKVSGSASNPININLHADSLKVGIADWLCAAAARVAEALNVDDPQPKSNTDAEQARVVVACCRLLEPNLGKLLESKSDAVMVWRLQRDWDKDNKEWWQKDQLSPEDMSGVEIGLELQKKHKLARSLLGHTKPRMRQTLACPLCSAMAVYRTVRTVRSKVYDDVTCDSCDKQWTYADFQTICGVALRAIEDRKEAA